MLAVSTGLQLSSRLLSAKNCNGLWFIDKAKSSSDVDIAAGASIQVMLIGSVLSKSDVDVLEIKQAGQNSKSVFH